MNYIHYLYIALLCTSISGTFGAYMNITLHMEERSSNGLFNKILRGDDYCNNDEITLDIDEIQIVYMNCHKYQHSMLCKYQKNPLLMIENIAIMFPTETPNIWRCSRTCGSRKIDRIVLDTRGEIATATYRCDYTGIYLGFVMSSICVFISIIIIIYVYCTDDHKR